MNTYFSLCGCVVTTFLMSTLVNHEKKFVMEHIQNSTLAGGVAVGAVADLMIGPWAALTIGSLAGILSVIGFQYISPWVRKVLKIHDSCGVHYLHGMPGFYGSLISVIVVSFATKEEYGKELEIMLPNIGKKFNDSNGLEFEYTGHHQSIWQLAGIAVTLGIAIVGGTITGFILKFIGTFQGLKNMPPSHNIVTLAMTDRNGGFDSDDQSRLLIEDAFFDDKVFFEVHEEEKPLVILIHDKHTGKLRKYDPDRDSKII